MRPQLSIIIPVFNTEKYLCRCIDSCLEQDFQDFELIIVDDFSSTRCRKIYEKYKIEYTNIHYVRHSSNLGLLCARMTGIAQATGQYITHLDSDDWIGKNTYSSCMAIFKTIQCEVVMFNVNSVGPAGEIYIDKRSRLGAGRQLVSRDRVLKNIVLKKARQWGWHVSWNKIWKSEHLKKQLPDLAPAQHIVMFEDLWLSVFFFSKLKCDQNCYVLTNTDGIFYNRHEFASTKIVNSGSWMLKKLEDTGKIIRLLKLLNRRSPLPVSGGQFTDFINNLALINYPHPRYFFTDPLLYIKMCRHYIKATSWGVFIASTLTKGVQQVKNLAPGMAAD